MTGGNTNCKRWLARCPLQTRKRYVWANVASGKASIPSGSADLKGGGWNHRLHLSSAVALSDAAHLNLSAEMHLPETGEDTALLAARFWWYF